MTATYTRRFIVEGQVVFPIDMLRYDRCWPDSSSDAIKILNSIDASVLHMPHVVTLIMLCNDRDDKPEAKRWESFGWKVFGIDNTQRVG